MTAQNSRGWSSGGVQRKHWLPRAGKSLLSRSVLSLHSLPPVSAPYHGVDQCEKRGREARVGLRLRGRPCGLARRRAGTRLITAGADKVDRSGTGVATANETDISLFLRERPCSEVCTPTRSTSTTNPTPPMRFVLGL